MDILLGFDPGGAGKRTGNFGWCVAEYRCDLPLQIRRAGIAKHAKGAVEAALQQVTSLDSILAAGIDAPLFWTPAGDRQADRLIRKALTDVGASTSSVLSVNSLQGACLIQGILAAMLLRDRFPCLPLSESHPKAFLLMNHHAFVSPPSEAELSDLSDFLVYDERPEADHERDAALATLSAWAMFERPQGWTDLYSREPRPRSPLAQPLGYWLPAF